MKHFLSIASLALASFAYAASPKPTIVLVHGAFADASSWSKVILILGQNPGTNHPRMLTCLQKAKRAGATIVAINPLKEAGLLRPRRFDGVQFGHA